MGKFCEVCGKGVVYGNNVSHSNRKTRRTWAPNTQKVRVLVNGVPQRCAPAACAAKRLSAPCNSAADRL